MPKTEDSAFPIIEPIVESNGCHLVDIQYKKEGSDWYLRVFIDKTGGVGIVDCETVSRAVSDELDKNDFLQSAYILEVSSPGLFRELKKEREFLYYIGHDVTVKLYAADEDGQKEFIAILLDYHNGDIVLKRGESEQTIPQKQVASVKLYTEC